MTATTWVAFLRGINVGGHRKLAMADLRSLLAELGFERPETHIASGNVIFGAAGEPAELSEAIHAAIEGEFGYDVPTVVLSIDDLTEILERSPFRPPDHDPKKIGVGFAHQAIAESQVRPAALGADEEMLVGPRAVYLYYGQGMAGSKMDLAAVERHTGVPCTIRNWNTSTKVLELVHERT